MKLIRLYIRMANSVNEWVGNIFSWLVAVVMILTVAEIIMRRLWDAPTIWSFETCTQLFGAHFMIPAGFALLHGSHVAVDIVYNTFSVRKRAILDIVSYIIFFFPFNVVLLAYGIKFAGMSWATWETSWSVFAPPLYPLKTVIPVTAGLLLLQGLAIFIQKIHLALEGEELTYD